MAVSVKRLFKTFHANGQQVPVLRGVDFSVRPGEFVAIVGKSGSGKSTLLYCMSGLVSADKGEIVLAGHNLGRASKDELARIRRDNVGFVFQDLNLISSLSVADNVRLPATLAGMRVSKRTVAEALDNVGLANASRRYPDELSGGQRQRVAIARAVLRRPRVLFADEPTGSLDVDTGASIMRLLLETRSTDTTQVMVTHDLDLAAQADRVAVLSQGQISVVLTRPSSDQVYAAMHGRAADSVFGITSRRRPGAAARIEDT